MASPKVPSINLARLPLAARIGVGAAITGLVALGYFFVFYSDITGQIGAQETQEARAREDLAKARANESKYLADLAELTSRQQRQRELNKVLPESAEYPAFLSAVQAVANVTGVTLNSWDPMPEQSKEFFAKVPMKLTLMGRYHQLAKFFYGVGHLERIINLENISMAMPKREGDDVLITSECLATAFHTLAASSAATPAQPTPPTATLAPAATTLPAATPTAATPTPAVPTTKVAP